LKDWIHVVRDHVCREGEVVLWEHWIASPIVNDLKEAARNSASPACWIPILQRLAVAMEDAIQRSLGRPLAVLLRERKTDQAGPPRYKWILVLPNGAKMVIGSSAQQNVLVTCFFPDELHDEEPEDRWNMLAKDIILEFCPGTSIGLRRHPEVSFVKRKVGRVQDRIQFVTRRSWGFEPGDGLWRGEFKSDGWLADTTGCEVQPRLVNRTREANTEASNE
jgi:hypothetical protein